MDCAVHLVHPTHFLLTNPINYYNLLLTWVQKDFGFMLLCCYAFMLR